MKFFANAKVNLGLDVVRKRDDGYHEVSMIMQEISLCDELDIDLNDGGIKLEIVNSNLPSDESNIAYRAARLFFEESGIDGGCDMVLKKGIPVCAGMGGGSTDAAAVLKALNKLTGKPFSIGKLAEMGLSLGADVPFCIVGGTAHAIGIGEILFPAIYALNPYIALVKPDIDISTPEAYRAIDTTEFQHPDIHTALDAMKNGNMELFKKSTGNAFEYVCASKYPEINEIKAHFIKNGAEFSMMSGSGPTVFALFDDKNTAEAAIASYKGKGFRGVYEFIKNKF